MVYTGPSLYQWFVNKARVEDGMGLATYVIVMNCFVLFSFFFNMDLQSAEQRKLMMAPII
jgi:hypothetical protein